jgi:hypothetical protein
MSSIHKIRIKLIARGRQSNRWPLQLPQSGSFSEQCSFHFSRDEANYDWLVVVDDVSRGLFTPAEKLTCADEHTLLVTTEPPTITCYGRRFSAQFAHVLTSQPQSALPHPGRIYSHTGNLWFNGHSYCELQGQKFPEKTRKLSTVCSSKQQKHTNHNDRYQFCHWLRGKMPDMDLFGHGSKYIEHKHHALDPYRYHLAIENYSGPHHWTEKLADSFLSGCFPIYYGCTNVADYFPSESFIEIDIFKRDEALEKIRSVTENDNHYASRIEALIEARRRVMEEHNLMHMIESLVLQHHRAGRKSSGRRLYGRKQIRVLQPIDALGQMKWRLSRNLKQPQ